MSKFALVLLSLMTTPGKDAELLYFTSDNCHYCVQMTPIIAGMVEAGFPVRTVNVSQSPAWQKQFQITAVPCFIMLADGEIADRVNGATNLQRLEQMFERVGFRPASEQPTSEHLTSMSARGGASITTTPVRYDAPVAAPARSESADLSIANAAMARAMKSTVRLRVADATGTSFGTGTIIHSQGEEALILTCGHLFRDTQGQGTITVELGFPERPMETAGKLLAFEAENHDIALVVMKPGITVEPARIATETSQPAQGDPLFSIGCDEGRDPTVRQTQVKAITNYGGVFKVDTFGRPVDGRSGGGLFDSQGRLVGVCNAAAVNVDEGIYTGLQSIYWQLEQVGLADYFRAPQRTASNESHPALDNGIAREPSQVMPSHDPRVSVGAAPTPSIDASLAGGFAAPTGNQGFELICVVRSSDDPTQTETKVIRNPSPELLRLLNQQADRATGHAAVPSVSMPTNTINPPQRHIATGNQDWDRFQGPVNDRGLRAQSPR